MRQADTVLWMGVIGMGVVLIAAMLTAFLYWKEGLI